jgi:hypothetical protein
MKDKVKVKEGGREGARNRQTGRCKMREREREREMHLE